MIYFPRIVLYYRTSIQVIYDHLGGRLHTDFYACFVVSSLIYELLLLVRVLRSPDMVSVLCLDLSGTFCQAH